MGFVTDLMDARDEGMEAGIILGEQKGKKVGKIEGLDLAAKVFALYKQNQSISEISIKTGLSIADIAKLLGIKA